MLSFFAAGVLLAFTACMYPMIPILSSIIVGQGASITTSRAFALSLVYVEAMAATYAVIGVISSQVGAGVQAFFQNPWILSLFALIFVTLALSMFGFYQPAAARLLAGETQPVQPSPERRDAGRRRGDGRLVGPDRRPLRRAGTDRRPALQQPDGRLPDRGARHVRAGQRHGRPAAGHLHLGRQAAAEGRRLDGNRQGGLRRRPAGRRRADAGAHPARPRHAGALGAPADHPGRLHGRTGACPGPMHPAGVDSGKVWVSPCSSMA